MSEGFVVTRGILLMYFVIAVELLAVANKNNIKIKGITHNGIEKKITQFPDETVSIITAKYESLAEAVKPL